MVSVLSLSNCGTPLYWHNCYSVSFDLITPESIAHPAKMAPKLCFRILEHLEELGLLKEDSVILDPMAGTGMTALCAGAKGLKAITVELEERFVNFQRDNKTYAESRLYHPLDWQIIQGDSRHLSRLLVERGLVSVTSPPYSDSLNEKKNTTSNLKREERLKVVGHEPKEFMGGHGRNAALEDGMRYSHNSSNIGNLKDIPLATITSPPYGIADTSGGLNTKPPRLPKDQSGRSPNSSSQAGAKEGYGETEGQIGHLPDKPLATITSPPYENSLNDGHTNARTDGTAFGYHEGNRENIGNTSRESYLSAMLQVYSEIARVSNVLVVVLKNPTQDGKLRRLDLDTLAILDKVGWKLHCQHRALLFEELEQSTLEGGVVKKPKGRLSFFKRLSYQKGAPVASWEDILILTLRGC